MKLNYLLNKLWCFATGSVLGMALISSNVRAVAHISSFVPEIRLDKKSCALEIKGLLLKNIPGLPKESTTDISSLFLEIDPYRLAKGQLHFKKLNIHIAALTFTKTNADERSIGSHVSAFRGLPAFMKILIDRFELKLDRITVKNKIGEEHIFTHNIQVNFEETYKNLDKDYVSIASDIESKIKRRVMNKTMKNLDPLGVIEVIEGTYRSSKWAANEMSELLFGF